MEGAATNAEYLDGIGFLNGKGNPMKAFTKAADNFLEDIIYLKVLCNLYGPEIDEKILQDPFEFQFYLKLPQSMIFPNGDIQPLAGSPGKVKRNKKSAKSLIGILQDNGDDEKAAPVSGMPINQQCLGLDNNEGIDTGNSTGEKSRRIHKR